MSSQYGELHHTDGLDRLVSWGHPSRFQRVSRLASLLQRPRSTEANQTLHDVWPYPELVHYIYISGVLLPNEILTSAKFTLHPNLAFSSIGSITAVSEC